MPQAREQTLWASHDGLAKFADPAIGILTPSNKRCCVSIFWTDGLDPYRNKMLYRELGTQLYMTCLPTNRSNRRGWRSGALLERPTDAKVVFKDLDHSGRTAGGAGHT